MPRLIDQELMEVCVARVLGGEKASAVSKDSQIPYSTLMRYVGRRRPTASTTAASFALPSTLSKSKTTSSNSSSNDPASMPYTIEAEQLVFEWMKREQAVGRRLNRQLVLAKAAEALGWRHGAPAALSAWWFRRFRHRRPEVVGPASKLSVVLDASARSGRTTTSDDASENALKPASDELCAGCASSAAALDAVERAVHLLQAEYAHKLEAAEMAEAFDVVVDPFHARGFASMAPGAARDIWLYKQIRQLQGVQDVESSSDPMREHP